MHHLIGPSLCGYKASLDYYTLLCRTLLRAMRLPQGTTVQDDLGKTHQICAAAVESALCITIFVACRWDCHGLPVEFEIDKRLSKFHVSRLPACCQLLNLEPDSQTLCCTDIQTKDDVLKMGIDKYNEECRSIVMRQDLEILTSTCCCLNILCSAIHIALSSCMSLPHQGQSLLLCV